MSSSLPAPTADRDVSVVVPVYGGANTLEPLVERTATALGDRGWSWEIILVCDRPRDGSWDVARKLADSNDGVTAVLLRRNFGQHPATLLGIRRAAGRTIVTMDEDLQHAPEDIPTLVDESVAHGAVAYGTTEAPEHAWWRNVTSRTAKWFVARYLGFDAGQVSAFRAFPAELRSAFDHYRGERVAVDVLLSWAGAPVRSIRCSHAARAGGQSGYTFRKLVAYLFDLMLGYSTAPLRIASWMGAAAMLLAMGIGTYVLVNWIVHGSAVPGFAFIALSVAIFAGVQLLSLGLIGEYLGRLYFNVLGKPQYVVDTVVAGASDGQRAGSADAGSDRGTPKVGAPPAGPTPG